MSRLYWGIDSNLNPSVKGSIDPRIKYFKFKTPSEKYITIVCGWESDYGIDKGRIHNGRWKELDIQINDYDGDPIDWRTMRLEDFHELQQSKLYEVYVEFDEEFDDDFKLKMHGFDVEVCFEDEIAVFREKKINVVTNLQPAHIRTDRNIESNLMIQDLF